MAGILLEVAVGPGDVSGVSLLDLVPEEFY